MKKILTAILILTAFTAAAQTTTVNRQTVYLAATVDTLLARQARAFTAQITLLTNRLDQQAVILANVKPFSFDTTDFVMTKIVDTTNIKLRNTMILK